MASDTGRVEKEWDKLGKLQGMERKGGKMGIPEEKEEGGEEEEEGDGKIAGDREGIKRGEGGRGEVRGDET